MNIIAFGIAKVRHSIGNRLDQWALKRMNNRGFQVVRMIQRNGVNYIVDRAGTMYRVGAKRK